MKFDEEGLRNLSRDEALAAIRELRNLALVQDVTLHLVIAVVGREQVPPIAHSQILVCRDAYAEVTGDESLVPAYFKSGGTA